MQPVGEAEDMYARPSGIPLRQGVLLSLAFHAAGHAFNMQGRSTGQLAAGRPVCSQQPPASVCFAANYTEQVIKAGFAAQSAGGMLKAACAGHRITVRMLASASAMGDYFKLLQPVIHADCAAVHAGGGDPGRPAVARPGCKFPLCPAAARGCHAGGDSTLTSCADM